MTDDVTDGSSEGLSLDKFRSNESPHERRNPEMQQGEFQASESIEIGQLDIDAARQSLPSADVFYAQLGERNSESEAVLRQKWGNDAEVNVGFAQAAALSLLEDMSPSERGRIVSRIEADGLADDPAFLDTLALLGRQMALEPGVPASVQRAGIALSKESDEQPKDGSSVGPQERATERIREIRRLRQADPDAYRSGEVQAELRRLYRVLAGSDPVIGAKLRSV